MTREFKHLTEEDRVPEDIRGLFRCMSPKEQAEYDQSTPDRALMARLRAAKAKEMLRHRQRPGGPQAAPRSAQE